MTEQESMCLKVTDGQTIMCISRLSEAHGHGGGFILNLENPNEHVAIILTDQKSQSVVDWWGNVLEKSSNVVGQRFAQARKLAELTQSAAAKKTGIGINRLYELERGRRLPTNAELHKLEVAYKTDFADIKQVGE